VCGNTLMLSRGLLESEHLPAVLAHELGHINSSDGKLTAALNRLVVNPLARARAKQAPQRRTVVVAADRVALTITAFGAVIWLLRKAIGWSSLSSAPRTLPMRPIARAG
jgi:Zn-dependent protease with chaperone function